MLQKSQELQHLLELSSKGMESVMMNRGLFVSIEIVVTVDDHYLIVACVANASGSVLLDLRSACFS